MALSNVTITYDISDLVGTDFDARRTKVWVTTNIDGDMVVDTAGNKIRVGDGLGSIADDGTGSVSVWAPGTGSNPTTWQTYVHLDYAQRRPGAARVQQTFGPFTVSANADLADLIDEQAVPPTYLTTVTAQLQTYVDQARDIAGISTPDGLVAALVNDPTSALRVALDALYGTPVPPDPTEVVSVYGYTPEGMSHSRAAIAYVLAGTDDFHIVSRGDSIANGGNATIRATQSYCRQAAHALADALGVGARKGMVSPRYMGLDDPAWTIGSDWTVFGDEPVGRLLEAQTTATTSLDYTPTDDNGAPIQSDSFVIYAWGGGGANPPRWSINGGAYTTLSNVSPAPLGAGIRSYVITAPSRGFNTLHLKANPSAPSTVVLGAEAVDSMNRGVRWIQSGTDGQITPSSGGMGNALGSLNFAGADLVMPEWGVNEYLQQVPLATFKARVIEAMQFVQTTYPNPTDCLWITTLPDLTPTGLPINQAAYYATLDEASDETGVPILHWDRGVVEDPDKATYYSDSIHPNTAGHAAFGRYIAAFLGAI